MRGVTFFLRKKHKGKINREELEKIERGAAFASTPGVLYAESPAAAEKLKTHRKGRNEPA